MEEKIQEFLGYMVKVKGVSNNTVSSYRRDLVYMSKFFEQQGILEVSKISSTNVNSYILFLEKEGKSPASISRNISSMKTFYRYLINRGEITSEPTENVCVPKVEKKVPGAISVDIIEKLVKSPVGNDPKALRDKAMLELLYATGMRVTELISLKVEDINFDMRFVVLHNTKKDRIIPFSTKTKNTLVKYITNGRDKLADANTKELFVNCFGKSMSRQGFWKIIKDYAEMAGVNDKISPHTFRHSFGAHLVQNGADLRAVQEMMGHVDMSSTNVYLQLAEKRLRDVYDKSHPNV